MPALSSFLANAVLGHAYGKTAYPMPTAYVALFRATAGQSPRSAAVTAGQTTVPAAPNGHMYRCTTAGTTGAGEPAWPTGQNATVTDGTAVWTEMYNDFFNNTANLTAAEANYTGYARVATTGATWNAPASGSISNAAAITFGQDTAGSNFIAAAATYDAAATGNLLIYEIAAAASGVLNVTANVTPAFNANVYTASVA